MKKLSISLICFFALINCKAQSPFQVLYPTNTSITNAVVMTDYNDTANGKIVMNGWPFTGNFTINSFNISNNNYPCGRSFPYPATNRIYLNELFTGTSNALCYASGPLPDTIMYYLVEPVTNIKRDTMYFVVGGSFPSVVSNLKKSTFTISPNPANYYITLSEIKNNDELIIYSLNGEVLIKSEGLNPTSQIDISALASGLYILTLKDGQGLVKYEKLLKE
jgi:hypothetical protein